MGYLLKRAECSTCGEAFFAATDFQIANQLAHHECEIEFEQDTSHGLHCAMHYNKFKKPKVGRKKLKL